MKKDDAGAFGPWLHRPIGTPGAYAITGTSQPGNISERDSAQRASAAVGSTGVVAQIATMGGISSDARAPSSAIAPPVPNPDRCVAWKARWGIATVRNPAQAATTR